MHFHRIEGERRTRYLTWASSMLNLCGGLIAISLFALANVLGALDAQPKLGPTELHVFAFAIGAGVVALVVTLLMALRAMQRLQRVVSLGTEVLYDFAHRGFSPNGATEAKREMVRHLLSSGVSGSRPDRGSPDRPFAAVASKAPGAVGQERAALDRAGRQLELALVPLGLAMVALAVASGTFVAEALTP